MSQLMGLCLKELALLSALPTGESVSVLPTRIRTSSPRQNGVGSAGEASRRTVLVPGEALVMSHSSWCHELLYPCQSGVSQTGDSLFWSHHCSMLPWFASLACEHFFWKAGCSNNLRLTRKSSSLASVIYT